MRNIYPYLQRDSGYHISLKISSRKISQFTDHKKHFSSTFIYIINNSFQILTLFSKIRLVSLNYCKILHILKYQVFTIIICIQVISWSLIFIVFQPPAHPQDCTSEISLTKELPARTPLPN